MMFMDAAILNEAGLKLALAACGLTAQRVKELVTKEGEETDRAIMEELKKGGIAGRDGATKFAVAAYAMIEEFLMASGCPEYARETNRKFILQVMVNQSKSGLAHRMG